MSCLNLRARKISKKEMLNELFIDMKKLSVYLGTIIAPIQTGKRTESMMMRLRLWKRGEKLPKRTDSSENLNSRVISTLEFVH